MATNPASTFSSDIEAFIADETLPLARKQLVAYRFGDPLTLPKGRGTTYQAVRYNRIPLPYAALSEGVPPIGETMTVTLVSVVAQQWGDKVQLTDVAELTIKHPVMNEGNKLVGLQIGETLDRNTFNTLNATTNVNYVNSRGARASLQAGDVIDPHTVNRTVAALKTNGAPRFMGDEMTDMDLDADAGGARASDSPRKMPHYVVIAHTLVVGDFSENSTVVTAWSYSDLNRLYNYEVGEWRGTRWVDSNLVPTWTGVAAISGTAFTTGGNFATSTVYVQVTACDTQNQYESRIYQVAASLSLTGPTASIQVVLPALSGYTYNVYADTNSAPVHLGLCSAGPTTGPMAGQATQLAPGQTVTITGTGLAQVPPAAPATGVTVYPTYVIGRGAYGQVKLDDVKITWLDGPDKSDPLNQLRIIGWKVFYGTIILNSAFMARIESSSAFLSTYG